MGNWEKQQETTKETREKDKLSVHNDIVLCWI